MSLGGFTIRRLLRSRLPERFAGKLPPLLVEVGIGFAFPVLLVFLRLAIIPWTGEFAPYALVFVGVVGAAVLAGWLSGLLALVIGQFLIWLIVMEPAWTLHAKGSEQIAALLLASFAQAITLVIIALYQREIERASSRREAQMEVLGKALKEIDHRTSNNYQTVLALILAQANSAGDEAVRMALTQVADRIRAIADASRALALRSEGLEQVRVAHQLCDLCAHIERGLSRKGVSVDCSVPDIVMEASQMVGLCILVNELVTNALKHAFPDGREGTIRVAIEPRGRFVDLVVEDNGIGMEASGGTRGMGLGTRLIETFTRQLGARHEVTSTEAGTRHRIRIPAAR